MKVRYPSLELTLEQSAGLILALNLRIEGLQENRRMAENTKGPVTNRNFNFWDERLREVLLLKRLFTDAQEFVYDTEETE